MVALTVACVAADTVLLIGCAAWETADETDDARDVTLGAAARPKRLMPEEMSPASFIGFCCLCCWSRSICCWSWYALICSRADPPAAVAAALKLDSVGVQLACRLEALPAAAGWQQQCVGSSSALAAAVRWQQQGGDAGVEVDSVSAGCW
jgi:hypothetical protein